MLKKHRTYWAYANVYDGFKGDRASTVQVLQDLIRKYNSSAQSVLDLGCGTGSIAQGLTPYFSVVGLDSSAPMLRIARQKVPDVRFVRGNMANFALSGYFDVICCLHNSINHLLTFERWEDLFALAARHLAANGIFIFDSNPIEKMDYLATLEPGVTRVGDSFVITQLRKQPTAGQYVWNVRVLLKRRNGYVAKDEPVAVSSYASHKILDALNANFNVAEEFVPAQSSMTDDIDRVYYVCLKK
jgi:SAM-dependent methyltransferase